MKTEKPKNKKPLIYYYFVMLIALMAFNLFVTPMIQNQRIKEVGYSDLIAALDEKQVEEVQVDNQTGKIAYTIKDNKKNVFVTGIMPNDATLTERLEQSGAQYTAVIPQQNSFLMDMLMWLVPVSYTHLAEAVVQFRADFFPGIAGQLQEAVAGL